MKSGGCASRVTISAIKFGLRLGAAKSLLILSFKSKAAED